MQDIVETLTSAWQTLQSEAQAYPAGVRIWMAVMASVFFGGVVFTPWWRQARFVVLAMVATFLALVLGKALWPELPRATIGAIVHLGLWSPLLAFLVWDRLQARASDGGTSLFGGVYAAWLYTVIGLLTISLVFDGREVVSKF
jgi:hypothetical protein